jgi:RNA polymerase sigma-70 factor (ECF subfamily)
MEPSTTPTDLQPDRPTADGDAELTDALRAAAGDRAAFERLYRAQAARVHTLARRFLGPEHADEETQEIFVRAWQSLPSFRGRSRFATWLHRLAANHLATRYRSARRAAARLEAETEAAAPAQMPHDLTLDFEAALGRLPAGARQVLLLHDVEGYRHEEIAALLEISEGTSKSQLSRARSLLRRHLSA